MRDDLKAFSTLRAELALRGWALYAITDHDATRYVACRWGMTRELGSLDEVAGFLRHVAGPVLRAPVLQRGA